MAQFFEVEIGCSQFQSWNINDYNQIDLIDKDYQYDNFFREYLSLNKPVVITNVTNNWNSTKYWCKADKINLPYLDENYGKSDVMIYDCNTPYFNSQKTECSTLSEYTRIWHVAKEQSLYLKDWHLQNQFKDDKFYQVPIFFASDWLNEYFCENLEDDYRFVYLGPMKTWTPFHSDVFTSFSWSANICGRKKWILFPPGEEFKLKDALGNLPYDIKKSSLKQCRYFEIIQNPSEAIFVPSGWYHQVWNLEDTISINHNWVNGCNIHLVWKSLEDALYKVEKEIEDCKEMENFFEHCQLVLKASFGMDFKEFYNFLKYIAAKRIKFIRNNLPITLFHCYILGINHANFDLYRILEVLKLFMKTSVLNYICLKDNGTPEELIRDIETCIEIN